MHRCLRAAGAFALAGMFLIARTSSAGDEHDHGGHDHGGHGHSDVVTLTPEGVRASGIVVERASKRALSAVARVPARIDYNREAMAHVGTPLRGRIREVAVRLGDEVKVGDRLLVIDSPELGEAQVAYLRERAAVDAARATATLTRTQFEHVTGLRDGNWIKVTEWLEVQSNLQREESALQLAQANAQAAYSRLRVLGMAEDGVAELAMTGEVSTQFPVLAPISGRVVAREATLGETVGPDREALLVIANMETVWVLADVPERLAHAVRTDTPGTVEVGVPGAPSYAAKVDYVAPHLDTPTRTLQVRLLLSGISNQPPRARAGHDDHEGHDHDGHDHDGHDHEGHADGEGGLTPEEIERFKAAGDWCGEHGLPESQCALCNPGLAQGPRSPAPVDAAGLLRPGMFAQVELALGDGAAGTPVVAVPDDAVQTVEGRACVFVPGAEPNTFVPRAVSVGTRIEGMVPVRAGLAEGEPFVAKGAFILKAELAKEGVAHEH